VTWRSGTQFVIEVLLGLPKLRRWIRGVKFINHITTTKPTCAYKYVNIAFCTSVECLQLSVMIYHDVLVAGLSHRRPGFESIPNRIYDKRHNDIHCAEYLVFPSRPHHQYPALVFYLSTIRCKMGRDGSVSIAIRYGLDGPGNKSRWERDFPHGSRRTLGPIQLPTQWEPVIFRG
jgi:hypothetical protein